MCIMANIKNTDCVFCNNSSCFGLMKRAEIVVLVHIARQVVAQGYAASERVVAVFFAYAVYAVVKLFLFFKTLVLH